MPHFKAFDQMNMQYQIRICCKILNKAINDKNQHPPPLLSTLPLFLILFDTYLLLFFRDNGITIQILKYQLYCEGFMFLLVLFAAIIPMENDVLVYRIIGIMYSFVVFVMHPLFYLNGDVNFRNRVLQQGIWKALDQELFQRNTQIQPIAP